MKEKIEKFLPRYTWMPLFLILAVNGLVYFGVGHLMLEAHHYDLTTEFDRRVPVMPCWVIIYLTCYLFWALYYVKIVSKSKALCIRFTTAEITAKLICGVFYIVFPTTNVRPEILGTGFCDWLLRLVYQIDAPVNLFPSIHCLVSWFCYIGVRKNPEFSKSFRIMGLILAILVCASTQFVKQHYIADGISAVLLAELTWALSRLRNKKA